MRWKGETHLILTRFYDCMWGKTGDIFDILSDNTQIIYEVAGDFTRVYQKETVRPFIESLAEVNCKYFKVAQSFNQVIVEYSDGIKSYTDIFTINRDKIVSLKMRVE